MQHSENYQEFLEPWETDVQAALYRLEKENFAGRIRAHDHTLWPGQAEDIRNRLGWLDAPENMGPAVAEIEAFAENVRSDGFMQAVLLGMGGSSLAPEVLQHTFGAQAGYPELSVLDTSHPETIAALRSRLDLAKTLFIVSTKSGTTVETLSLMNFFFNQVQGIVGKGKGEAGSHFTAITDPGSRLAASGEKLGFRKIFLNDPFIGGRYSALSFFGLVPAALLGLNLKTILERARNMAAAALNPLSRENSAIRLGAALAAFAAMGRDKLTLLSTPALGHFGAWVEQLLAESTGKNGKGILPVVGDAPSPGVWGEDRFFVYLGLKDDSTDETFLREIRKAGFPLVRWDLTDLYDLGGEFFRWEMATAAAGSLMGINPFDQPNVESAKLRAREMLTAYQSEGRLPTQAPDLEADDIRVYCGFALHKLSDALPCFLSDATPKSYVALQAFLHPGKETDSALNGLRTEIEQNYRLATTIGYGPRFLHSTGQLHKGDGGHGMFIQFTADITQDLPIPEPPGEPGASITFGILNTAQALGDRRALLDAGRHVIRFHLGRNPARALQRLTDTI